jgi:hypothetical protein
MKQPNATEDLNPHQQRCENFKPHKFYNLLEARNTETVKLLSHPIKCHKARTGADCWQNE